jgi:GH35 family endo-1,4-beta-xylanase
MIDINELRRKLGSDDITDHVDIHANVKPTLTELLDRLEAAEKDIALKERIIDSLGSELNAVANERDELRARIEEMERQEPVEWQSRSRPSWGAHQWGNWESCSPGYAQDITKSPTLHDWQYEARPLYTLPGAKGE